MTGAFPYVVSLANPAVTTTRRRGRRWACGPGGQPGPCGDRPGGVLQDGLLVLDDGADAQAVVPRRGHGAVDADGGRDHAAGRAPPGYVA
jgi:hypothetical protein